VMKGWTYSRVDRVVDAGTMTRGHKVLVLVQKTKTRGWSAHDGWRVRNERPRYGSRRTASKPPRTGARGTGK